MSEWRVELIGDAINLQYTYEAFSGFDPCVIHEEDKFFLKASEFEAIQDAERVRNRAREIAKMMNDAVHLHYRDTRPIATDHIIQMGINRNSSLFIW